MTTAGIRAVVSTGKGKMDNVLKKSRWVWKPKGNWENVVKPLARCEWRPINVLDNVSKDSASMILKRVDYIDAHGRSKKHISTAMKITLIMPMIVNAATKRVNAARGTPQVLGTKSSKYAPYELLIGKFDEKSDEGYFLGYSTSRKAFRVYNKRTKRVEENLHINFLEDQRMWTMERASKGKEEEGMGIGEERKGKGGKGTRNRETGREQGRGMSRLVGEDKEYVCKEGKVGSEERTRAGGGRGQVERRNGGRGKGRMDESRLGRDGRREGALEELWGRNVGGRKRNKVLSGRYEEGREGLGMSGWMGEQGSEVGIASGRRLVVEVGEGGEEESMEGLGMEEGRKKFEGIGWKGS
ncbi:hypothetical protein Tco_0970234 [Tanacetum coccineum]